MTHAMPTPVESATRQPIPGGIPSSQQHSSCFTFLTGFLGISITVLLEALPIINSCPVFEKLVKTRFKEVGAADPFLWLSFLLAVSTGKKS